MCKGYKESEGKIVVENLVKVIHENRGYLSEIDGAIGDGDHGINMDKGFSIVGKRLATLDVGLSESFKILGTVLIEEIGGSMGPLYGTIFRRMARVSKKHEYITKEVFLEMLQSAYDGLYDIGNAEVGDKTNLDTFYPAIAGYKKALERGDDFASCLTEMVKEAKEGWLSTKEMIAKVGRASRLGERSRGVLDAGATSCFLILESLANSLKEGLV